MANHIYFHKIITRDVFLIYLQSKHQKLTSKQFLIIISIKIQEILKLPNFHSICSHSSQQMY
jgi:hypothetical protein